jgi:hypothetical protein
MVRNIRSLESSQGAPNAGPDERNDAELQAGPRQAKQLVGKGGPATGRLPVILVGDLNSQRAEEDQAGQLDDHRGPSR